MLGSRIKGFRFRIQDQDSDFRARLQVQGLGCSEQGGPRLEVRKLGFIIYDSRFTVEG